MDQRLTIKATPGFEYLDGEHLTLNGEIATSAVMTKRAGTKCGICGGTNVRSYVSLLVARPDLDRALAAGDADGRVYPLCENCESMGQDVFLPAMERRLRADLLIEGALPSGQLWPRGGAGGGAGPPRRRPRR